MVAIGCALFLTISRFRALRFLSVKIGGRPERAALAQCPSTFHLRRMNATIDLGLFTFRAIARLDSPLRWQPISRPYRSPIALYLVPSPCQLVPHQPAAPADMKPRGRRSMFNKALGIGPEDAVRATGTAYVGNSRALELARSRGLLRQFHDRNSVRLERRRDEALGVRVSVVCMAPSLLDLGHAVPTRVIPGFSHAGIVPDDAAGWRVSSGISRFPSLLYSAVAPYSPHFALIGSQDLDVKSRPNHTTSLHCDALLRAAVVKLSEQLTPAVANRFRLLVVLHVGVVMRETWQMLHWPMGFLGAQALLPPLDFVTSSTSSTRSHFRPYNSNHPVWNALYECLQDIYRDSSPFLLQPFHELSNGFWPRLTSPHPGIQFVRKMFYRRAWEEARYFPLSEQYLSLCMTMRREAWEKGGIRLGRGEEWTVIEYKRRNPKKVHRPTATSSRIPTCENTAKWFRNVCTDVAATNLWQPVGIVRPECYATRLTAKLFISSGMERVVVVDSFCHTVTTSPQTTEDEVMRVVNLALRDIHFRSSFNTYILLACLLPRRLQPNPLPEESGTWYNRFRTHGHAQNCNRTLFFISAVLPSCDRPDGGHSRLGGLLDGRAVCRSCARKAARRDATSTSLEETDEHGRSRRTRFVAVARNQFTNETHSSTAILPDRKRGRMMQGIQGPSLILRAVEAPKAGGRKHIT
ncbi:hypothetical protein PR048_015667 [Dryococelus australis]|uniref:Uncharacterized protein n=1 Tax=Dryococelus australis TaxID=614101 RepID=A0ABQ9HHJ9_9NEOP|nr:hypothetical protein PR048_015667 [Dryococelus australis]